MKKRAKEEISSHFLEKYKKRQRDEDEDEAFPLDPKRRKAGFP